MKIGHISWIWLFLAAGIASQGLASASPPKPEKGGEEKASSEKKPEEKKDAKKDPKKKDEGAPVVVEEPKHIKEALGYTITPYYVYTWSKVPDIPIEYVEGGGDTLHPVKGLAHVFIFIASWCIPCQTLMPEFQSLEAQFEGRFTQFHYVLSHDTRADAMAFKEAYKLVRPILGTHEVIKAFHNPELPSIYIADRQGWMLQRFLKTKKEDLEAIKKTLRLLTGF